MSWLVFPTVGNGLRLGIQHQSKVKLDYPFKKAFTSFYQQKLFQ